MRGTPASGTAAKVAGAAIKALRVNRKWSLAALGLRVGMTRQGVQRVEAGLVRSSIDRYEAFANALGVSLASLFPRVDPASHHEGVGQGSEQGASKRRHGRSVAHSGSKRTH